VSTPFESEAQVYALIEALTRPLGVIVNESRPFVELRLTDDTRVNIIIPPIALTGPSLTIRKTSGRRLTLENLLAFNCLSQDMATFIKVCVEARCNILVSGGTSSGKTTLLNIIARMIPTKERIVLLQQEESLILDHPRLVRLETRPPNIEGQGEVSMRELVGNAMRMRPDRIILVEARGGEAYDLMMAMNSGYDGNLMALHSNGPRDTIDRLETMVSLGNPSLPLRALREQIASALDLIVHIERQKDGTRKVVSISEVSGIEDGVIVTSDIFYFRQAGMENGRIVGSFVPTGIVPRFMPQIKDMMGIELDIFTPKV
jgi:pilus assembly protein CpaF